MALTILVTPADGDTIEAATWINEFNNIYNNFLSGLSPLTANLAFGAFRATGLALGSVSDPAIQFTGDSNTGHYSSAADTLNGATAGVLAYQFGASWILAAAPEDSRTASVDVAGIIRSTTSGTPAAGIGVGIAFQAESGDETPSTFGRIDFAATDVGAGTEDTYMDILLRVAGDAEETKYRFASTAGVGFQGTFTHGVTADRTWTLPDETGSVLTSTGHNVAAAIHGLPASVNVLGNRTAAGEFIQRDTASPINEAAWSPVRTTVAFTFAVAFATTPYLVTGGYTSGNVAAVAANSVTTTGGNMVAMHPTGAGITGATFIALGT